MEQFLYHLSKTPHVSDFILKGGLMFYGLGIPMRRTTHDINPSRLPHVVCPSAQVLSTSAYV
jgi:hypothetical protein